MKRQIINIDGENEKLRQNDKILGVIIDRKGTGKGKGIGFIYSDTSLIAELVLSFLKEVKKVIKEERKK